MKKILILIGFTGLLIFASCRKDETGNTIPDNRTLTGIWYVDSTVEENDLFSVTSFNFGQNLDFTREGQVTETIFGNKQTVPFNYIADFTVESDLNFDTIPDTSVVNILVPNQEAQIVTTVNGANPLTKTYYLAK